MTEFSDDALILACRRGDQAAWEALVYRYQRLIYTIPLRAGLGENAAADVFQRTFLRLLEHLERLKQPARVQAWLVTTAKRETWRQVRQRQAELSLADTSGADAEPSSIELHDEAPLPDEIITQLEAQNWVRRAVAALDERCRTLLTMLFYHPEPPPYAEGAAALGIPEGSLGPTRAALSAKSSPLVGSASPLVYFFS